MEKVSEKFIESLSALTDKNLMQWSKIRTYLNKEYNRILENYLVEHVQYNYDYIGDHEMYVDGSYVAEIDNSLVYLLAYKSIPEISYRIYVQNDVDADIKEIEIFNRIAFEKLVLEIEESVNSQERTMQKVINIAEKRINDES